MMAADNISVSDRDAWQDETHASVFDGFHTLPGFLLTRHYEGFNEGRLLARFGPEVQGTRMYEIGCATGELYRFMRLRHRRFEYHGFDVSAPAIRRAKQKYPSAAFNHYDGDLSRLASTEGPADLVWCRDVVLHQHEPFEFIDSLLNLTSDTLIMRLRTRDTGATMLDTQQSCQLHWDRHWAPYVVLNTQEMLDRITAHAGIARVVVARSYEVLGGHNFRYLPKDLYFEAAGGAETAVLVQRRSGHTGRAEIQFADRKDRSRSPAERIMKAAVARLTRNSKRGR